MTSFDKDIVVCKITLPKCLTLSQTEFEEKMKLPDEYFEAKKERNFTEMDKIRTKFAEEVKNQTAKKALKIMEKVSKSKSQDPIVINSDLESEEELEDGEISDKLDFSQNSAIVKTDVISESLAIEENPDSSENLMIDECPKISEETSENQANIVVEKNDIDVPKLSQVQTLATQPARKISQEINENHTESSNDKKHELVDKGVLKIHIELKNNQNEFISDKSPELSPKKVKIPEPRPKSTQEITAEFISALDAKIKEKQRDEFLSDKELSDPEKEPLWSSSKDSDPQELGKG